MSELIFLLQVLLILMTPLAAWHLCKLRGAVPLVVVQVVIGIALGPSLFGRLTPGLYHLIFNANSLSPLWGVGSLAVLLFSFATGLHLDPAVFVGRGRPFVAIAGASIVVPTLAGFAGGLWIAWRHPGELGGWITPPAFATAIGICVGVTALPVLGALLREMDLLGRRIADLALAVAAVNDAGLWLLLGMLMTALAGKVPGSPGIIVSLIGLPLYLLVMLRVVGPLLERAAPALLRDGRLNERALAAVCAVVVCSAITTDVLGLHYIFGSFIAGVTMPRRLREALVERLQVTTLGVLMPFFFVLTGQRALIDLGSDQFIEVFAVTTVLAVLGKVGGTALAARMVGEDWFNALSLGALVQTKGLMELIVLTVLLDSGILTTRVFSALVLMAVLTTMLAMPATRLVLAWKDRRVMPVAAIAPVAIPTQGK